VVVAVVFGATSATEVFIVFVVHRSFGCSDCGVVEVFRDALEPIARPTQRRLGRIRHPEDA